MTKAMRPLHLHRKMFCSHLVATALVLAVRDARACGAAYPGGPVMCDFPRKDPNAGDRPSSLAAPPPATRPVARLSASYAFTSTTILFGDGRRADLTRHAVFGSAQVPLNGKGTISALIGAGGIAGGELVHGAARDTIGPGFAGFSGIAGRVYDGRGALPFVQLTLTLSMTNMLTRTDDHGTHTDGTTSLGAMPSSPHFTALDLRAGAIVGKTFADVFTPYVTGRVFGGPITWHFDESKVTGTDLYKYQVGGGLSLALFERRFDVFAEGIALGERGVAAGVGTTFF
jgi:hypothetical protein